MKIDYERDGAGWWCVIHRGKKTERGGPFPTDQRAKAWAKLYLKENADDDTDATRATLPDSTDSDRRDDVQSDGEVVGRRPRRRRD